jgi:hypothetical protein
LSTEIKPAGTGGRIANFAQRLGGCPDAACAATAEDDGMAWEGPIVDLADRHAYAAVAQ